MKKILIIINLLFFVFFSLECKAETPKERLRKRQALENKIKVPDGVDKRIYFNYLADYGPEWSDYRVTSEKTLAVFKNYFKETPYRVIWHWDVDGCGYNDYLAVEVYPKVRRGIKRGILVDEIGRVKMYIDTVKGVYAPDTIKGGIYMIYDLKQAGIRDNELECFAIGYNPSKNSLTPKKVAEYNEKYDKIKEDIKRRGLYPPTHSYGIFYLQKFDKDLKIMGTFRSDVNISYFGDIFICLIYVPQEKQVLFELFTASFSLEQVYDRFRKNMKKYRIAKKQGITFGLPQIINPDDIKIALKIQEL